MTGETLEMAVEELVGAPSESPDDRIAVLAVEDQSRSTEEILRELLSDPRVLSAEPDYIINLDAAGTGDRDDNTPEFSVSISDEDVTGSDYSEDKEDDFYGEDEIDFDD